MISRSRNQGARSTDDAVTASRAVEKPIRGRSIVRRVAHATVIGSCLAATAPPLQGRGAVPTLAGWLLRSPPRHWPSATGGCRRSRASISRWGRASSSACSGPNGAGSRRSSRSPAGSCGRRRQGLGLGRARRVVEGARLARLPGGALPLPRLDVGRRAPASSTSAWPARAAARTSGAAARARRARRRARPPRRGHVQGHAAAARHRPGSRRHPEDPAARRADERARPGRPPHRPRAARGAAVARRLRPPQLAPAQRGRARLRPRRRSSLGGRSSRRAPHELAHPRGVEIETDDGVRLFPGAKRDDAPRLVAEQVAAGRKVYGVRVLARRSKRSTSRPCRGRRRDPPIIRYALGEAVRRKVFLVVVVLTRGLPRARGAREPLHLQRPEQHRRPRGRARRHADVRGHVRDRHVHVRHALPRHRARRLPHARRRLGRRRARPAPAARRAADRAPRMLFARFLAAAGVCSVYVFVVYIVSVVITGTEGDWWPQDIVTPGSSSRARSS